MIVASKKYFGSIYEHFRDTIVEMGIKTRNTVIESSESNIFEPEVAESVSELGNYSSCILMPDDSWGLARLEKVVRNIMSINENIRMITYRIYPFHGYGNEVIIDQGTRSKKILVARKLKRENIIQDDRECNFDDILEREFLNIEQVKAVLKRLAANEGFDIVCRDSQNESRRMRFICSEACKKRNNKEINGETCPFIVYVKRSTDRNVFTVTRVVNVHNHELHPSITRWKLLTSKQTRIILSFRRSKMPLVEINKNVAELFGIDMKLTGRQLKRMKRKGMTDIDKLETDELIEYIHSEGGFARVREEIDQDGRTKRTAILVIEREELLMLQSKTGNPLFIDGTSVPNRLNWELTMLTLVDQYLSIQPGGCLFSLHTNIETFKWFLEQLMEIIGTRQSVTIITDEDLAISSCITDYNQIEGGCEICHVICAWHKERNFYKKLAKCAVDENDKAAIKALWKRICYSAKKEVVINSISQIKEKGYAKVNHYLEKHVEPLLQKFARAFIPGFTAGYNVSSLSESANSLLKRSLTAAYYTLTEIKQSIRHVFQLKNAAAHEKLLLSRRGGSFLENEFGISVPPKIAELLVASLLKSFRLENIGDDTYRDTKWTDEIFKISNNNDYPICECNKLEYSGLPCSHIMKWSLEHNRNPMSLVSERYLEHAPSVIEVHDYCDNLKDLWIEAICSQYREGRKAIVEAYEGVRNQIREYDPERAENIPSLVPETGRTHVVRFNEIMSYARDLARISSKDENKTQRAIEALQKILDEITRDDQAIIDDDGAKHNDTYDGTGRRRGRPPVARIHAAFEKARKRKCKICQALGQDADHLIGLCKYYLQLKEIGKEMDAQIVDTKSYRRCKLCGCRGHNARKCKALANLIPIINTNK